MEKRDKEQTRMRMSERGSGQARFGKRKPKSEYVRFGMSE
jgi:hypothetical protein